MWPVRVPPQSRADEHCRPPGERVPAPIPWPDPATQRSAESTARLVVPPFAATGGRWGVAAQGLVVAEPAGPHTVASPWSHPWESAARESGTSRWGYKHKKGGEARGIPTLGSSDTLMIRTVDAWSTVIETSAIVEPSTARSASLEAPSSQGIRDHVTAILQWPSPWARGCTGGTRLLEQRWCGGVHPRPYQPRRFQAHPAKSPIRRGALWSIVQTSACQAAQKADTTWRQSKAPLHDGDVHSGRGELQKGKHEAGTPMKRGNCAFVTGDRSSTKCPSSIGCTGSRSRVSDRAGWPCHWPMKWGNQRETARGEKCI